MDIQTLSAYAAGLTILSLLVFLSKRRRYRFPPGPRGLPFWGNVFDIPEEEKWVTYLQWSRSYGSEVIHLKFLSKNVFVLNSILATKELLDKRSHMYSDRQTTTMIEGSGWSRSIAVMEYGEDWQEHRRLFQQEFNPRKLPSFHPRITKEVRTMVRSLLESPEEFLEHIRHMAGAAILGVVYGVDVQPVGDPLIELVEKAMDIFSIVISPGSFIVDSLPLLKYLPAWFPGAGYKAHIRDWEKIVSEMFDRPSREVKSALAEGKANPSIAADLFSCLNKDEDNSKQERIISNVSATAYAAGSEGTAMVLSTLVLAMMLYPDAQRRAHEELDRVLGRNISRLPEFEDLDALPYITAMTKEILRWRPIVPLAPPHKCTQHNVWNGYDIPAGSLIISNSWAILHDEDRYPDPEPFKPERFLTADGKLDENVPFPIEGWGYGRRMCPGRYFAMESLRLAVASILAVFTIDKPVDAMGNVEEPSGEYTSTGLVNSPKPFKTRFKPRSAAAVELTRASAFVD